MVEPMTAEELESLAATAKRLKAGANEREGHSLKELIELDRYLGEKAAAGSSRLPLRMFRTRPPGAS